MAFLNVEHTSDAKQMMKRYLIGVLSHQVPAHIEANGIQEFSLKRMVELAKVNGTSSLKFNSDILNEVVSVIDANTNMSVVVVCGHSS